MDEFGPLNLQPHPGKQWAPVAAGKGDPERHRGGAGCGRPTPAPTGSATCWPATTCRPTGSTATSVTQEGPHRVPGVLPLPAIAAPARGAHRDRARQLQPAPVDQEGPRVGDWAAANNVELAYVPFYASWLNRIEAQFTALRYFALDGTDHAIPPSASPHDPPLHRLAEPQRPRPSHYANS